MVCKYVNQPTKLSNVGGNVFSIVSGNNDPMEINIDKIKK